MRFMDVEEQISGKEAENLRQGEVKERSPLGGHKEVRFKASSHKESSRPNEGLEERFQVKGLVIEWRKKPAKQKAWKGYT